MKPLATSPRLSSASRAYGIDSSWNKKSPQNMTKHDLEPLGEGSAGSVFNIEGTEVPLIAKIPELKVLGFQVDDYDPKFVLDTLELQMQPEAELYAKVGDHPNIVRCFGTRTVDIKLKGLGKGKDKVLEGEGKALVQERLSGRLDTAHDLLKKRLVEGKISQTEYWGAVQHSLVSILQGLDHLSSQGYTHGDIKPENIMYNEETGDVKLIDLGEMCNPIAEKKFGGAKVGM
jgi:serine/threonine protein kinase